MVRGLMAESMLDRLIEADFDPAQHPRADDGKFTDAGGGASAHGVTNTPAFKAWFGTSKVVDAAGKPLVMYHNALTNQDIGEFRPRQPTRFDGTVASKYGLVFFSEKPAIHTKWVVQTIPAYLSMQNPWDFRNPDHVERLAVHLAQVGVRGHNLDTLRRSLGAGQWSVIENNGVDWIKEQGFDGIVMQEAPDLRSYAVFLPPKSNRNLTAAPSTHTTQA